MLFEHDIVLICWPYSLRWPLDSIFLLILGHSVLLIRLFVSLKQGIQTLYAALNSLEEGRYKNILDKTEK